MAIKLIQFHNNEIWVHVEGRTFCLPKLNSQNSQRGKNRGHGRTEVAGNEGEILSPMPGKILKILVSLKQNVKAQQAVCIIEAMKMEYTLKSSVAGNVVQIFKKVGEPVQLGEKILEISAK